MSVKFKEFRFHSVLVHFYNLGIAGVFKLGFILKKEINIRAQYKPASFGLGGGCYLEIARVDSHIYLSKRKNKKVKKANRHLLPLLEINSTVLLL